MIYVAPASKVLTVLHVPEDDWEANRGAVFADSTRCGVPMLADDLWQEVARKPGDRVCRSCEGLPGREPSLW